MDGRKARTETKTKQAPKQARKRTKKGKPYILSSLILSLQIRLILSLKTKTTHQSTQAKRKTTPEKQRRTPSKRIENGRKRHKHGKTGAKSTNGRTGGGAGNPQLFVKSIFPEKL